MIFTQIQRAASNFPAAMLRGGLAPDFTALPASISAADLRPAELQNVQFLDIKDINDKIALYRDYIRTLIAVERAARALGPGSLIRQIYANRESQLICRQIHTLWKVYRTLKANSHLMTAAYITQLKPGKSSISGTQQASLPTEKDDRAVA